MEKTYILSESEKDQLERIQNMLNVERERIYDLCLSEKDQLYLGFELGKAYSHITELNIELLSLTQAITNLQRGVFTTEEMTSIIEFCIKNKLSEVDEDAILQWRRCNS